MRQRMKLLGFIKQEAEKGRWPLRSEMVEFMGWKSASSVDDAVWALVKHGYLTATPAGKRSWHFEVVP